jgi:hypothetical protein
MVRHKSLVTASVVAVVVLFAFAAGLAVAGSTPSKTTSSAKKQVTISSPSKTPVTIGKISRGKPLPKGYSLASREVKVTRGKSSTTSSNSVSLSCPGLLTVSALADSSSLGRPMPFTYNKEQTFGRSPVRLYPTARDVKVGKSRSGTLYALCVPNT